FFSGVSVEDVCLAASPYLTLAFVQSYLKDMTAGSVSHSVLGAQSGENSSGAD
ncbi:hypothetical protein GBF38_007058, partial [Nibea albiflora]